VKESIKQSLEHLQVDYLDALLLHIYFENDADNLVAWKVFETFVPHKIRSLGVSNFTLSQLKELYAAATVKPTFVQNTFYKETGFDFDVREFCAEYGITYQAYGMLKHNPEVLRSEILASVAEKLHVEKELAFYVLILGLENMQVLDGTTKPERMLHDVKTVTEIFSNGALLGELRRDIEEFRGFLMQLAGCAP